MNVESIREFAITMTDAEEGFPFGESTLVFKVKSKVFLLLSLDAEPISFNVKCDPEKAIELRETYPDTVLPGYHMNKKHWNTVLVDGQLTSRQLKEFITDSYDLVLGKKKGT